MILFECACGKQRLIPEFNQDTYDQALEQVRLEGWMIESDHPDSSQLCPVCSEDWLLNTIIRPQYKLNWNGIHGLYHWKRVETNGLRLAKHTGANKLVVHYFAFLHDAKRIDDNTDTGHGERAAIWIQNEVAKWLPLKKDELEMLLSACAMHDTNRNALLPTVATCFDADRLDLPRVGKTVDPKQLSTNYAKLSYIIDWAAKRAKRNDTR